MKEEIGTIYTEENLIMTIYYNGPYKELTLENRYDIEKTGIYANSYIEAREIASVLWEAWD